MKRVLINLLTISGVALLMLASCKKNDPMVTTNGGTPGALTSSASTLVLDKAKVTDTATKVITFSSTSPQYTYKAAVTNTLQIDSVGDNWQKPTFIALPNTGTLSQSFNTPDFNSLLLKMIPAGVSSAINIRVQYSLSSGVNKYSNVVSMNVTPFNLTSWIYVAGAFEGWAVPSAGVDSLVSTTGNGVYTGIINFTAGNTAFKILVTPKNYNGNIGSDGTPTGLTAASSQSNITSTVTGQTLVTVNLNTNTISFAAADYYSLIGNDFQGQSWDTDNFMKYVNDGTGTWTLTLPMIAPSGGGFKVRQDAAWSNSWGTSSTAGILTNNNGGNLGITAAGTYKVNFVMPASVFGTNTANPLTAAYAVTLQ
jgi:hypothetical protein